jgi:hypothetical protein
MCGEVMHTYTCACVLLCCSVEYQRAPFINRGGTERTRVWPQWSGRRGVLQGQASRPPGSCALTQPPVLNHRWVLCCVQCFRFECIEAKPIVIPGCCRCMSEGSKQLGPSCLCVYYHMSVMYMSCSDMNCDLLQYVICLTLCHLCSALTGGSSVTRRGRGHSPSSAGALGDLGLPSSLTPVPIYAAGVGGRQVGTIVVLDVNISTCC